MYIYIYVLQTWHDMLNKWYMPGYIPMGVPTSAKVGVKDNVVFAASCGQGSQASTSGDPKQALVLAPPATTLASGCLRSQTPVSGEPRQPSTP